MKVATIRYVQPAINISSPTGRFSAMKAPQAPSTYSRVSHLIANYVVPIKLGAFALPFNLYDENGRALTTDDDFLAGKYLILIFVSQFDNDLVQQELAGFAAQTDKLQSLNAIPLIISASSDAAQNKSFKRKLRLELPILGDPSGAVHAAYGLHKGSTDPRASVLCSVLLTPLGQIRSYLDASNTKGHAEQMVEQLQNAAVAAEAQWQPPHAPVLMIPKVLQPEECAALIQSVENNSTFAVDKNEWKEATGNVAVPLYEYDRQDRMNLFIRDQSAISFIDERLATRVNPMIKKVFAFDVKQREELHIARYEGTRGGMHMGHRDNITPETSNRRFAISVSLSDDYEGGEICFREFSSRGYRGPIGTATIFSSSLLHEVMETTKGVRHVLISHLY